MQRPLFPSRSALAWSALVAGVLAVTSSGCDAILGIHDVDRDPTGGAGGTGGTPTGGGGTGGTPTGGGGTGGTTGAADFAFGLKTSKVTLPLGGAAFVAFEIVPKNGFAEPVTVSLEITPNGVTFDGVAIDPGATTGKGQLGYTGLLMIGDTIPLTFLAKSGSIEHTVDVMGTVTGEPGKLVDAFGAGGITKWLGAQDGANIYDVREVAQGKILAVGDAFPFNTTFMKGARILPDGTMDTAFGADGNGTVSVQFCAGCTANSQGRAVLREVGGSILMIGKGDPGSGAPDDIAIAHLEDDGTFFQFGKNLVDISGADDFAGGAALSKDGGVVIAASGNGLIGVAKVDDFFEQLDPGFGTNGFVQFPPGVTGTARDIAVEPVTGDLLLLAATAGGLMVVRLDAAGNPTSFGGAGWKELSTAPVLDPRSIAIDAQGRIVVAATTNQLGDNDVFVGRLLPDGTPDPTFGTEGIAVLPNAGDDRVADMVLLADDRVVVGGMSGPQFDGQPFLARLLTDGTPDPTFGGTGRIDMALGPEAELQTLAAAKNGEVFLGGTVESQPTRGFVAKVWQ